MYFSFKPIIWHWLNVDGYPNKQTSSLLLSLVVPAFLFAFGPSVSQEVLWLLMPNRFSFCLFQKFLNGRWTIPVQSFLPSPFICQHLVLEGKECWLETVHYTLPKDFLSVIFSGTCNSFFCIVENLRCVSVCGGKERLRTQRLVLSQCASFVSRPGHSVVTHNSTAEGSLTNKGVFTTFIV